MHALPGAKCVFGLSEVETTPKDNYQVSLREWRKLAIRVPINPTPFKEYYLGNNEKKVACGSCSWFVKRDRKFWPFLSGDWIPSGYVTQGAVEIYDCHQILNPANYLHVCRLQELKFHIRIKIYTDFGLAPMFHFQYALRRAPWTLRESPNISFI